MSGRANEGAVEENAENKREYFSIFNDLGGTSVVFDPKGDVHPVWENDYKF